MKKLLLKKEYARSGGFTIIETLVAITILMVAIAGPLTVAHKGLTAALYARDQMIGAYLAQDVIEYVKNYRDNNKNNGRQWLTGLDACMPSGGGRCAIDTLPGVSGISGCLSTSCSQLYLDESRGGYTHVNRGTLSPFTRSVVITPSTANPNTEAKISVTVSWKNGTVANSVVIENQLFDTFR